MPPGTAPEIIQSTPAGDNDAVKLPNQACGPRNMIYLQSAGSNGSPETAKHGHPLQPLFGMASFQGASLLRTGTTRIDEGIARTGDGRQWERRNSMPATGLVRIQGNAHYLDAGDALAQVRDQGALHRRIAEVSRGRAEHPNSTNWASTLALEES